MSAGTRGWTAEKRLVFAKILSNAEIARTIYRMEFEIMDEDGNSYPAPAPGQFINVYLTGGRMLLPRPFSVCDSAAGRLTLVYGAVGAGTRALAGFAPGERIRVGPPAGNGFDVAAAGTAAGRGRIVLVGGGVGAAPLLLLARRIRETLDGGDAEISGGMTFGGAASATGVVSGVNATYAPPARSPALHAVLGYRSEPFLVSAFEKYCDQTDVATDDGASGFHGTAVDLLKEQTLTGGEFFFACGPRVMLRALARFAGGQGIPLQVSLEERMGCGYGACLGCACKVASPAEIQHRKVCKDGPVFNGSEVVWDV
ncbi:MAG: dihydroorotate dehydrogenase electron transfer subunit [Clostridiales Family XIII bacterium]|jgi:dihydroorotate dehydrogenase electron transfer subunit|nr:dihydroorotate dehydrogenase electron transfer subunit [Clostridiales Family XIII bacterium]